MDLNSPQFSLLALIAALAAGFVLGRMGANPHRAEERKRRERADRAAADQAFARLPDEKRREIEALAKAGKKIEAIRLARMEISCGLKEAKELVEHKWPK